MEVPMGSKRLKFSEEQKQTLNQVFNNSQFVDHAQTAWLAKQIGVSIRQIRTWFQNKRAKCKRMNRRQSKEPVILHPPILPKLPSRRNANYLYQPEEAPIEEIQESLPQFPLVHPAFISSQDQPLSDIFNIRNDDTNRPSTSLPTDFDHLNQQHERQNYAYHANQSDENESYFFDYTDKTSCRFKNSF